jgi:hypothetical protein
MNTEFVMRGFCALHIFFFFTNFLTAYCSEFLSDEDDGASSSSPDAFTPLQGRKV